MVHPRSWQGHDDPYRALGVNTGASRQDIARAYRRAAQRAHPDTQAQDPQAIARFQALTAYDLLSDPGRRADYDRGHPAAEPASQPPQPRYRGAAPRWPSSPYLLWPPSHQPIWAGPVHIEPPGSIWAGAAHGTQQDQTSPPVTEYEDPPIVLGTRSGHRWCWL
jgi:hypothetical protein